MCNKQQCEKCFTIHKNYLGDTVQCVKEKLLKYLAALEHNSEIQQKLFQKITDLKQRREFLYEQYQKEFASTEQSCDHKIYSLCQEKQIVLSKLMTFGQ